MINFLKKYIEEVDLLLKKGTKDWRIVLEKNLEIINFMQHERLIHLLVTLFFGLMFVSITVFLLINYLPILFLADLLLVGLLISYIFHYFKLENGVQKLYQLNELIRKRI